MIHAVHPAVLMSMMLLLSRIMLISMMLLLSRIMLISMMLLLSRIMLISMMVLISRTALMSSTACMQAALEDIDTAVGSVKTHKSSWGPRLHLKKI